MDDSLQQTLRQLMRSGTESNAALNVLLADYTRYHLVLVAVGGLFLLALTLLSVFMWRRFAGAPRTDARRWTFEKKVYFYFGILGVVVALFMGLVVAANVSTVLNPRQGFVGSIGLLGSPAPGTQMDGFHQAVEVWLGSESPDTPAVVQSRIDDRLSWQRPKAIICSVLLLGSLVVSALVWRALIRRSRDRGTRWGLAQVGLLVVGIVSVLACLLLMLMVMGNTQGALAPISLTLFLG